VLVGTVLALGVPRARDRDLVEQRELHGGGVYGVQVGARMGTTGT
jgi:hypothetical protein